MTLKKTDLSKMLSVLPLWCGGRKEVRLAVIGSRGSGKSYLLFDLIHAFAQLGFVAEPERQGRRHGTLGTFFYDALSADGRGMKPTKRYFCQPSSHYRIVFRKGALGRLHLDFLNIAGDVFDGGKRKLAMFFELKRCIELAEKGVFTLSEWRNAVGACELMVNAGQNPSSTLPAEMGFMEVSRKEVSGKALLKDITHLNTASLMAAIRSEWKRITSWQALDLAEYESLGIINDFYALMVCLRATDIVVCDRLSAPTGVGELLETLAHYIAGKDDAPPNVYLAFREADLLLKPSVKDAGGDLYATASKEIASVLKNGVQTATSVVSMDEPLRRHIMQSIGAGVGHAFWHLLNACTGQHSVARQVQRLRNEPTIFELAARGDMPPHVYFTATPIDAELHRYRLQEEEQDDASRFYCDDGGQRRWFTTQLTRGQTGHLCFGSLQLLRDILDN